MFATALPSALAASQAMRRLIAAEDLTVRPAVAIAAAAAVADASQRDAATTALAGRLAGRTVQALVLQKLDDGTAKVQIEGDTVHVAARLPDAGRAVLLRFPATTITTGTGVSNTPAPASTPAVGVTVGALAHALSDAARAPAEPLPLGRVNADPARPGEFAAALAAVVRDSGMFYEAHLARWSQGQYPLALLQREPQAASNPIPGRSRQVVPEPGAPVPPIAHADSVPAAVATGATATALPEALQPVIREQLQVLEHRSLAVMIEPWPGQAARLEIAQEDRADNERRATAGTIPEGAWVTRLSLDLPSLGRVDAELALAGNRLSLVIHADPENSPDLACHTAGLAQAMSDAGITLSGCKVVNHAAP